MDRRATLATLLGRTVKQSNMAPAAVSGLEPYNGPWTYQEAAHLLRRCLFGATDAQIKTAVEDGLNTTLEQLLADTPLPPPPINYDNDNDPNVAIGETWIDAIYPVNDPTVRGSRTRSLLAWTMGLMLNQGISIREKMVLFWHNHFVIANINDPKFVYRYSNLLRENALGNFRALVKAMTIDPSMLRYLNGNQNTAGSPNENYARELLELFTIGKGQLAGPGDYTNYTEDDVVAMAKVLTGWRDYGFVDSQGIGFGSVFLPAQHDTSDKQLSNRFNNVVISNGGDQEYAQLIDIIFEQDEVARFICRKLYRWFVYYQIDADIEANVIEPMAQMLIDSDYEIRPALAALLGSTHFFDTEIRGCMIKNPMDFTLGILNQFDVAIEGGVLAQYRNWVSIFRLPDAQQMTYYDPPNVAGWKAYYQEPVFYQSWINSVTLPIRMDVPLTLLGNGIPVAGLDNPRIDSLVFLDNLTEPADINLMLAEIATILFPNALSQNQLDYFKQILIPGLPDFEWNVEYFEYLDHLDDDAVVNAMRSKMNNLLYAMLTMPEYQLS